MAYTIVSETEANLKEGKISVQTPIAQGLLGKRLAMWQKSKSRTAPYNWKSRTSHLNNRHGYHLQ